MDVRREIASILVRDGSGSARSAELAKLVEFDESLSSIAGDVVDLQGALTRLRGESEEVERLLEERQAELAQSGLLRSRLAEECARAREDRAEARASLAEAASHVDGLHTQVASLEQALSQREDELAEAELARARLAEDCARVQEGLLEAQASLADANDQLDARDAQVAALDDELGLLRLRVEIPQTSAPEPPTPEHRLHLRLMPHRAGYELAETPGPPPKAGEWIAVGRTRFSVSRVGRSPLPGDGRPCAFLLAEADEDVPPVEGAA